MPPECDPEIVAPPPPRRLSISTIQSGATSVRAVSFYLTLPLNLMRLPTSEELQYPADVRRASYYLPEGQLVPRSVQARRCR